MLWRGPGGISAPLPVISVKRSHHAQADKDRRPVTPGAAAIVI